MRSGKIWAIADLHLAVSVPEKDMAVFGEVWEGYMDKIASQWRETISKDDLVLIPGDICWAMRIDDAKIDLEWLDALPGTKVMIKGNHDYWWTSLSKVKKILPPSIHLIQNNAFDWEDVTIGGTRLWDTPELRFDSCIEWVENPQKNVLLAREKDLEAEKKIFDREIGRLEMSLKKLNPKAKLRIAMTHYPPVGPNLELSLASEMLEKYKVDVCVFGHLHRVKKDRELFGELNGIRYLFVAADHLDFYPLLVKG